MQIINVSLAKAYDTVMLPKIPRQTPKFPDIPVKTEFSDCPESGNSVNFSEWCLVITAAIVTA